jgi:hypothetical protein
MHGIIKFCVYAKRGICCCKSIDKGLVYPDVDVVETSMRVCRDEVRSCLSPKSAT